MSRPRLGDAVRRARQEMGLTQREVAAKIRVKASYIAYIEQNERRPSLGLLIKLADVLGLDRKEMFFLSYPAAKIVFPEKRESAKAIDAWGRFASNRSLHQRHKITPAELKVLKQVSLLQDIRCPAHFIFVLNSIRQAGVGNGS